MHWNGRFASKGRVDALVAPLTDPVSGQPALKASVVEVRPFAVAWYGYAVTADRPDLDDMAYAALGRAKGGWRVELAGQTIPADPAALARVCLAGGDETVTLLAVSDAASGRHRFAAMRDGRVVGALWMAPEPVAVSRAFAADQLGAGSGDVRALLAGRPGGDIVDQGALVCTCFDVGVRSIEAAVRSGACRSVDDVTKLLKAGGNCGSCRPEIRRIVEHAGPAVPA